MERWLTCAFSRPLRLLALAPRAAYARAVGRLSYMEGY